ERETQNNRDRRFREHELTNGLLQNTKKCADAHFGEEGGEKGRYQTRRAGCGKPGKAVDRVVWCRLRSYRRHAGDETVQARPWKLDGRRAKLCLNGLETPDQNAD